MQGLLIRATARIVDVGDGFFVAELDGEDGTHIDFREQPTQSECLRQLQWAGNALGYRVEMEPDVGRLKGREPGMRSGYSGLDRSLTCAGHYEQQCTEQALALDRHRVADRVRTKRRNNESFGRWIQAERAAAAREERRAKPAAPAGKRGGK